MRRSEFSSFLHPNKYSQDVFQDQVSISASEEVKITTLDAMIHEIVRDLPAPRMYLKMDTQGYDLEVLKGAVNSINKILALQSELSVLPLYVGMPDYLQALGIFKSYGFEPAGFYPIARDPSNQALIEIDCVMVKVGKPGAAS